MIKNSIVLFSTCSLLLTISIIGNQVNCDTTQVNNLLIEADSITINHPKDAILLVDSALNCSKALSNEEYIAKCRQQKFEVFYAMGEYSKALQILRLLQSFYINNNDSLKLSTVYNDMGLMYTEMSDYPTALEYLHKAIKIRGSSTVSKEYGTTLGNIGMTYIYSEKFDDALEYTSKALEIFDEIGWEEGIATMNSNLGSINTSLEKYDSAKVNFQIALNTYKKINHNEGIARVYNLMGMLYYYSGQIENSIDYFQESAEMRKEMGHLNGYLYALNNIAYIYNKLGQKQEAIKVFKEGLESSNDSKDKRVILLLLKNISDTYYEMNQYKSAFDYKMKYVELNEEVLNKENNEQIEQLKIEFETEQKEAEIANLKALTKLQDESIQKRQIIIFLLAGIFGMALLLGFVSFNRYKLKKQSYEIALQQRLLRTQMNPHFLFNSLSAIQGYIFKGNPTEAAGFIASFAKLMRNILNSSRDEYIEFTNEIETLENYLSLQKLRHNNRFTYSINVSDNIVIDEISLPPMLAQPFIENSIEHGIKEIEDGELDITFSKINGSILLEIKDNGVGLDNSNNLNKDYKSLATQITKERLDLLFSKSHKAYKFEINNLEETSGTRGTQVIIEIPYKSNF